jgi:hypothetical protein
MNLSPLGTCPITGENPLICFPLPWWEGESKIPAATCKRKKKKEPSNKRTSSFNDWPFQVPRHRIELWTRGFSGRTPEFSNLLISL